MLAALLLALQSFLLFSPSLATTCEDLTGATPALNPSEIHHELYGKGNARTLVLIHGLDSAGATFTPILEALSRKYQVLVYDQRGHGRSAAPGQDYSLELLARDLAGLLAHLGIRQAHLLGHSFGGKTAVKFASLFPGRALSIIVEDMHMTGRPGLKLEDHVAESRKLAALPVSFGSRDELIHALTPFFGYEAKSLSFRRARQNEDGTMDMLFRPHVTPLYGYYAASEDLNAEIKALSSTPMLYIRAEPAPEHRGRADAPYDRIRAANPAARIEVINGATHNVHGSRTGAFLNAVEQFLSNLP